MTAKPKSYLELKCFHTFPLGLIVPGKELGESYNIIRQVQFLESEASPNYVIKPTLCP